MGTGTVDVVAGGSAPDGAGPSAATLGGGARLGVAVGEERDEQAARCGVVQGGELGRGHEPDRRVLAARRGPEEHQGERAVALLGVVPDETEAGFSYPVLDRLLYWRIDRRRSDEEMAELGFDPELVARVDRMIATSEFKRQVPPIAKLGPRTAGVDYLYPRRRPGSARR